ncbi:hypothetical protein BLNAU_8080 [Blattamonas nauphoetae]|uniref:Uncharacterized protein n=1 Tax=Blattamonas nauphoetae TaxID=2049346 RepID=A0ABQ9XZT7_9EUKA|nr:hypothetical protein BLNAU_8080 [Blattamonas nauphoetae]
MTATDLKTDDSTSSTRSVVSIPPLPFPRDCSPFLNWREDPRYSFHEKANVFRSLVATLKFRPALDVTLEAQAVKFLKYAGPQSESSADAFLNCLASPSDDSSTSFVQSIVVLLYTPSHVIATAAMEILSKLMWICSAKNLLLLVKADLISGFVITLHTQSLSFGEAVDIHINVMKSIRRSIWLASPYGLAVIRIEDDNEQQAVYETVFQHVIAPSEKYIWHLCVNRYSIVHGNMSIEFMVLLARLLQICPYHQPTMAVVLHMPVFLTIPSCLTFFEDRDSICNFLRYMIYLQREWNKQKGEVRQKGKNVHRLLRMEGFEDAIEEKLLNHKKGSFGDLIVAKSIEWNNLQGINLPRRCLPPSMVATLSFSFAATFTLSHCSNCSEMEAVDADDWERFV